MSRIHRTVAAGLPPVAACAMSLLMNCGNALGDAAPPRISLYADAGTIWIAHARLPDSDTAALRFAVASVYDNGWGPIELYNLEPMQGRIAAAATVNDRLHVFFNDGSHWALSVERTSVVGRTGVPRLLPLRPIPHRMIGRGALPLLLAGDSARGNLYAVVSPSVAAALDPRPPGNADAALSAANQERLSADRSPILDPFAPPVILRYAFDRWVIDRLLPQEAASNDALVALGVHDGCITLLVRRGESSGGAPSLVRFASEADRPGEWSSRAVAATGATNGVQAVRLLGNRHVILYHEEQAPEAEDYHLLMDGGDGPDKRIDLVRPDLRHPMKLAAVDMGPGAVYGLYLDATGNLHTVAWSLEEGRLLPGGNRIRVFEQALPQKLRSELTRLLGLVIFPATLLIVLLARRSSVLTPAILPAGMSLAPAAARLAAFFIDSALLMPVYAVLAFALLESPGTGNPLPELIEVLGSARPLPLEWFWTVAACAATYGLYGTLFESASGATPGKRLLGLKVVRLDGTRCGLAAALLRNVLRVVDVYFAPALLLTVMTVNRQRLGDIVARTIVVIVAPGLRRAGPSDAAEVHDEPSNST